MDWPPPQVEYPPRMGGDRAYTAGSAAVALLRDAASRAAAGGPAPGPASPACRAALLDLVRASGRLTAAEFGLGSEAWEDISHVCDELGIAGPLAHPWGRLENPALELTRDVLAAAALYAVHRGIGGAVFAEAGQRGSMVEGSDTRGGIASDIWDETSVLARSPGSGSPVGLDDRGREAWRQEGDIVWHTTLVMTRAMQYAWHAGHDAEAVTAQAASALQSPHRGETASRREVPRRPRSQGQPAGGEQPRPHPGSG